MNSVPLRNKPDLFIKPVSVFFFSVHLTLLDLRFLRQKNSRPLINTRHATPPKAPPTMPPMLAFPELRDVGESLSSEPGSGAMIPAEDTPDGRVATAEVAGSG